MADRVPQAQRPLPSGRRLACATPICRGLRTYRIESRDGRLFVNLTQAGGAGADLPEEFLLRLVSSRSVATFIKELVLNPSMLVEWRQISFTAGDYLQFEIPTYERIRFRDFVIPPPFAAVWEAQHVFDLVAANTYGGTAQQLLAGV